jgi:integrase
LTEKKRKKWLNENEVERFLQAVRLKSNQHYLMFLLCRWGLRIGEVVGWRGLRGIRKEDLRQKGVWIKGKGYAAGIVQDVLYPLPDQVLAVLRPYADSFKRADEKLFPISEPWAETLCKRYAKDIGLEDWNRVSPHRLRAFFNDDMKAKGIDLGIRKDAMRHKRITTTMTYESRLPFSVLYHVIEKVANREGESKN